MSNLSDKYSKILLDIDEHISNETEKKYVMHKIEELSSIYMELIDRLTNMDDTKISEIEKKQQNVEKRLAKIQETVSLIKNDIYEDDDGYDFEIVCPYCNHEFVADIEDELREEIECPECHNIIELDWNEEDNKTLNNNCCSSCSNSDCGSRKTNNTEENENKTDTSTDNKGKKDNDNNDDDM